MIISEQQVMELIHYCKTFQIYLMHGDEEITDDENIMYGLIEDLLGLISFQQSSELKVIE